MMTQRITTLLVALALITLAATAQNAQKSTSNGKKSTIQLTQQYINFLKKKAQGKQQSKDLNFHFHLPPPNCRQTSEYPPHRIQDNNRCG